MPATSNYEVIGHVLTLLRKREGQPFTRYDAGKILKMHDRTALRLCQAMVAAKLLTTVRKGRTTHYVVKKSLQPVAKNPAESNTPS